jgi:hypothetical protein
MVRFLAALLALAITASGADLSASLLAAAADGKTNEVKALIERGAPVDARDKKQRTPLMLAAQHGHADTVRFLLAKGAQADARDEQGYTAYALTLFSPAGRGSHQEALNALPAAPQVRLSLKSEMSPARLQSSCFMSRGELAPEIGRLHLDAVMREEFVAFAGASGKGLVEIVREPSAPAEALASFTVLPSVACSGAEDNLSVEVHVRVFRSSDQQVLLEKIFGGGIKGLRSQPVNNAAQYGPVLLSWIQPKAGPVYWAVVEALYRSKL